MSNVTEIVIIVGLVLAMINDYTLRKEVKKYEECTKKMALLVSEVIRSDGNHKRENNEMH